MENLKKTETILSWKELNEIIKKNELSRLKRSEELSKKYKIWKKKIENEHETIMNYILKEKLKWNVNLKNLDNSDYDKLFKKGQENGVKILLNSFPYSMESDVHHLVVWTKIPIPTDGTEKGDLSTWARNRINKYVENTFIKKNIEYKNIKSLGAGEDNILWFRNWKSLQSIPSISHIHVLVRGSFTGMDDLLGTCGVLLD